MAEKVTDAMVAAGYEVLSYYDKDRDLGTLTVRRIYDAMQKAAAKEAELITAYRTERERLR